MPSSSSSLVSAAVDGASLTMASVEFGHMLGLGSGRVFTWPGDLLQKGIMTMEYALQQFQEKHPGALDKLGGIAVATEGLQTSFRMFDEKDLSPPRAVIVTPVTKVIIAPL